jgi:hypothetical protein
MKFVFLIPFHMKDSCQDWSLLVGILYHTLIIQLRNIHKLLEYFDDIIGNLRDWSTEVVSQPMTVLHL